MQVESSKILTAKKPLLKKLLERLLTEYSLSLIHISEPTRP